MPFTHRFLKAARSVHLYLGVFTAPALLFFAITGALQTFGLHEAERDGSYRPPAWVASVAQLHKKQTLTVPVRRARPSAAKPAAERAAPAASRSAPPARRNLWPMKLFFALVSLGLLISTVSGLYMAWRYSRKPRLLGAVAGAGVLVPLLLLLV